MRGMSFRVLPASLSGDDAGRLRQQVLVTLADQMLEFAHVRFHLCRGSFAVAFPTGFENALVSLDDMLLVAHGVAHAVMLAVRQNAYRRPEGFHDLVAARARDDRMEDSGSRR